MRRFVLSAGLALIGGGLAANGPIEPEVLPQHPSLLRSLEPHRWTGWTTAVFHDGAGYSGSGVAVAPRVILTAAHLLYDSQTQSWVAPGDVSFTAAHHSNSWIHGRNSVTGAPGSPLYRWTDYATRVDEAEGSVHAFNLDIGAVVTGRNILGDGSFAPSFVDESEAVSILRHPREKWILGYPVSEEDVPEENHGRMHQHRPGLYDIFWAGSEYGSHDPTGFPQAVYLANGLSAYGGNSGGPVFVEGNEGQWLVSAIVVGAANGERPFTLLRGLDADAWEWVRLATLGSGNPGPQRVRGLSASSDHQGVALRWDPAEHSEASFLIERRAVDDFAPLSTVDANTSEFLDRSAAPGMVYQYRVIAFDASGNRAPPSAPLQVQTNGWNSGLARILGEPFLHFVARGEAAFAEDSGGQIRSGRIFAMESSALELQLIGPGELRFTWGVSSESNPDFSNPRSANHDLIYDAVRFFINGVQDAFLSGEVPAEEKIVSLNAGPHTLRWEYRKDPYEEAGSDSAILAQLRWSPAPSASSSGGWIYGGRAHDAHYRFATWFGYYSQGDFPWTFHHGLGWLWLSRLDAKSLWAYSPSLGWLYLAPEHFPFVYSAERGSWLHYYPETGHRGEAALFYDTRTGRFELLPAH